MASFKLNLGMIDNCPPARDLAVAIEEYGLPDNESFGVLNTTASSEAVYATLIRRVNQAIQKLDEETGEVATAAVEKVNVLPIGIFPKRQRLEVYDGSASSIEHVAGFLASELALPSVVTPIELDVISAVKKLRESTEKFQLKSVRVTDFAHNSYMCGPYVPTFMDSEHGMDFMQEYADFLKTATVRFQGPTGRATVHLTPQACFRYSIGNEDDKPHIQATLRKLI